METTSRPTHTQRRTVATGATILGTAAFAAIVTSHTLVANTLTAVFGTARNPVFPTPLLDLTLQHGALVLVSSALTIAIGLPMGIWATRESGRDFRGVISAGIDFGQVFPPIAVLAVMFSACGLGPAPAILALFLYGLFPVVSSTIAGLEAVPHEVVDAARGMGMGRWRVLFFVELPLAAGVILAGVRTSVIVNIGTATVAAATGAGGLGLPVFTGISTDNIGYLAEGAITVSAFALLVDGAIAVLSLWLRPECRFG